MIERAEGNGGGADGNRRDTDGVREFRPGGVQLAAAIGEVQQIAALLGLIDAEVGARGFPGFHPLGDHVHQFRVIVALRFEDFQTPGSRFQIQQRRADTG